MDQQDALYIFQGGPDNVPWFEFVRNHGAERLNDYLREGFYWVCPKGVKIGDRAFIYLTAPLSRIVGLVEVTGEPFWNYPDRFDNSFMAGKRCVRISFLEAFDTESDLLTIWNLRKLFAKDWGWVRYPRGSTKIPATDGIRKSFLELVDEVRNA